MDLTKDTIEKIVEMSHGQEIKLEGKYTTRPIYRNNDPVACALNGFSLAAVVDYLKGNPDAIKECLIEIQSQKVSVISPLNEDMNRSAYFCSEPELPSVVFGSFMDIEQFKIMLMSGFVQNDGRDALLAFLASICEESKGTLVDDGVSQSMAVKTGIATLGTVTIPSPLILKPYRTFYDIEQPESAFIFRMKEGMRAALFEADGGAWKGKEVESIKTYLADNLAEEEGGLIINLLG